jgi:hypothetical protein
MTLASHSTAQLNEAKLALEQFALGMCDATDGQIRVRRVRLTQSQKVAALAGHESLETTRCYCTPSLTDLAQAVALIGAET